MNFLYQILELELESLFNPYLQKSNTLASLGFNRYLNLGSHRYIKLILLLLSLRIRPFSTVSVQTFRSRHDFETKLQCADDLLFRYYAQNTTTCRSLAPLPLGGEGGQEGMGWGNIRIWRQQFQQAPRDSHPQ